MKSRISFFNTGIFKSMLRRFWPLWTAYFVCWFMSVPLISLVERLQLDVNAGMTLISDLDVYINISIVCSAVVAVLAAMAVFSFLYNSRSCGMVASAPVGREAVFCSAYLAGTLPIIVSNLLIGVFNTLFSLNGGVATEYLIKANAVFFGVSSMTYLIFFSIAAFTAMLTANIIALPILYFIFNFVFLGMEYVVRTLYGMFVYGFTEYSDCILEFLSPSIYLIGKLQLHYTSDDLLHFYMSGWTQLIIYLAAGLMLCVIALLLYRKRRMEAAGDIIAVKPLRPVFKYCVTICAALCFGLFFYVIISSVFTSLSASILVLSFGLLIGAFIGYFASEMLLKKSFHVFKGNWKGYIIVGILCIAFAVGCVTDILNISAKLPDAEEVEYVLCEGGIGTFKLKDTADIEAVLKVNKAIVNDRSKYADIEEDVFYSDDVYYVNLCYVLRNGTAVNRGYTIYKDDNYEAYLEILSSKQVIKDYFTPDVEVTVQNVYNAEYFYATDGEDEGCASLTPEQAVDFYENALMKDIENGLITLSSLDENEGYSSYFTLGLVKAPDNSDDEETYASLDIVIRPEYTACVDWIKSNLGSYLPEVT